MDTFNNLALALGAGVDDTTTKILTVAVAISGIALLAQVVLDVIKFYLRPKIEFHHWHLKKFVAKNTSINKGIFSTPPTGDKDGELVLKKLVTLSAADDDKAFYAQSHTTVTAAIKKTINLLIKEESPEGRQFVVAWCPENVVKKIQERSQLIADIRANKPNPDRERLNQIENYLDRLTSGALKGLELKMERRWTLLMNVASSVISLVLTGSIIMSSPLFLPDTILPWAVFAITVSILAPFSHDLVSGLIKVTKRSRGL